MLNTTPCTKNQRHTKVLEPPCASLRQEISALGGNMRAASSSASGKMLAASALTWIGTLNQSLN